MSFARNLIFLRVLAELNGCFASNDTNSLENSLFTALYNNKTEEVKTLIKRAKTEGKGSLIEQHPRDDAEMKRPLHIAVAKNNIELAEFLLTEGASIDAECKCVELNLDSPLKPPHTIYTCTPLSLAAKRNSAEFVRFLLEKGASTRGDVGNRRLRKPALHYAVQNSNEEIINLIIKHKGEVDVEDCDRTTPLFHAVLQGSLNVVKILLDAGANATHVNGEHFFSALHAVVEAWSNQKAITELLMKKGANLEQKSREGFSPLEWALFAYNQPPLDMYIKFRAFYYYAHIQKFIGSEKSWNYARKTFLNEKDASPDRKLTKEVQMMESVIINCRPWIALTIFVQLGAHIDQKYVVNALSTSDYETARLLFSGKVNILDDMSTNLNWTCWHMAIFNHDLQSLSSQVNDTKTIDSKNVAGDTPLLMAVKDKYFEGVKFLVEKGANVNIEDSTGNPPISVALEEKSLSILKYLYQHAADIKRVVTKHNMPADLVAERLYLKTIPMIVKEGFPDFDVRKILVGS